MKGGKDSKKTTSKGRSIKRRLRHRFLWPEDLDVEALATELMGIRVVVDERMPKGIAVLPEHRKDETILHVLRLPPTE